VFEYTIDSFLIIIVKYLLTHLYAVISVSCKISTDCCRSCGTLDAMWNSVHTETEHATNAY